MDCQLLEADTQKGKTLWGIMCAMARTKDDHRYHDKKKNYLEYSRNITIQHIMKISCH